MNYLLAEALIRQDVRPGTEEFAEVSAALRHALSIKPDYGSAHVALGKLYNRTGDYSSAARELRAGLQFKPSDRTALSQLAIALRHLGRTDEAAAVSATLRQIVMKNVQNGTVKYPAPNNAGAK